MPVITDGNPQKLFEEYFLTKINNTVIEFFVIMEKRFDLRYCEKFPNDSLLNGFAPRDLGTKPKCLPQQIQETVSWEQ